MRKEGHTIKAEKVTSVQLTGHQNPKYCKEIDYGRLLKSEKILKGSNQPSELYIQKLRSFNIQRLCAVVKHLT